MVPSTKTNPLIPDTQAMSSSLTPSFMYGSVIQINMLRWNFHPPDKKRLKTTRSPNTLPSIVTWDWWSCLQKWILEARECLAYPWFHLWHVKGPLPFIWWYFCVLYEKAETTNNTKDEEGNIDEVFGDFGRLEMEG